MEVLRVVVTSSLLVSSVLRVGGATIRRQDESWFKNGISPFPLDIQVEQYVQFKERTNYLYNKADTETSRRSNLPIPEDFSKALYTIDIRQNDLVVALRNMNDEQFRAEIPDIVNKFSVAVQISPRARAFWIHNTGPIGRLPLATVNIQNPKPGYLNEHGCIKGWNAATVEFNKQLKDAVTQLRAELPQAALTYVDMYTAKYRLINAAKNQAERLKLPYLSAYLDSVGTNFQQGANFATAGATIRQQDESWFKNGISPFPLDIQVEQYVQFKARTNYLYNKANTQRSNLPIPEDFSKALYTIDIGQNDLVVGFRIMNDERFRAEIPDIVNKFSAAVQQLYQEGARAFWIHNTGPIGCLPLATVNIQNPKPGYLDEHGCIKGWNAAAVEFNKQLKDAVTQLRADLPQAALTYVDMYAAKYRLINETKNQGFLDPFNICCGHYGNGVSVGCGIKANINGAEVFGGSCEDPSTVISWDGVHYSEAANFWIANQILNGSFSDPPNPITQAYFKHV
ncbi:hypothetical protein RHSIM_Rhsim10G0017200 [Rhododendron simsii]|uniref:Uncharacterized protein n=1 Tax=Rhododendron simsii TaxID=118357 RepID=A0A834G921_RHOSS|nr:hypothetical protein RHSIM_Rhsim10G0017200 [Rhododendron simsii]